VFLTKDMELYRARVRVEGVPWHQPAKELLELKIPKIPRTLAEACMGFFYAVFDYYRSEAIVLLYFVPALQEFRIEVPEQEVEQSLSARTSYSVKYQVSSAPEGAVKLGTWHSHANLPAYHSREDDDDEREQDGLHLVVGDLDTWHPSFSCSFVVSGKRFKLLRSEVFESYVEPAFPVPEEWLDRVKCVEPSGVRRFLGVEKRQHSKKQAYSRRANGRYIRDDWQN
jgi:proteasome lid subunit RPN8/RPN11